MLYAVEDVVVYVAAAEDYVFVPAAEQMVDGQHVVASQFEKSAVG